jgi:hypothetical protein
MRSTTCCTRSSIRVCRPKVRPKPRGVDRIDGLVDVLRLEAGDMQDRAEDLALEIADAVDLHQRGADEGAVTRCVETFQQAPLGRPGVDIGG